MRRPSGWRGSPLPVTETEIPLADVGDRLTSAVREAGALALTKFGSPVRNWTKGTNSPVCDADIEADLLLRDRLMRDAPGYGWLSEESIDDPARLDAAQGRRSVRREVLRVLG